MELFVWGTPASPNSSDQIRSPRETGPASPSINALIHPNLHTNKEDMATVALIGSKGSLGYKVLPELITSEAIKKIHCLSRKSSTSNNAKVEYFQVDYKKPETVETALKGCDVLINTMGTEGNYEESKHALVDAAAKVGVKFYIPR